MLEMVVVLVVRILFALHVAAVGTSVPLGGAAASPKENVAKILYPLILSYCLVEYETSRSQFLLKI